MTIRKSVNLVLKSSNHNPYTGMLSKKDNFIAAIDLAKLCKDFADKGQMDEAMNLDSDHWQKVIDKLKSMQGAS
jgi:mitochondrial fission protein ELM1